MAILLALFIALEADGTIYGHRWEQIFAGLGIIGAILLPLLKLLPPRD